MNPNYFLAASIAYLCGNRPEWRPDGAIGKTVVSSGMIDRVTAKLARKLIEVPVGFKWFSADLIDGSLAFGGEESAGAAFLRSNGAVWTTDKDGLIMGLLAAEMTARTGVDPHRYYISVTDDLGESFYERIDAPATVEQKARLARIEPADIGAKELAGEPVEAKLTHAPSNGAAIGGVKLIAKSGWFAARPSGTEDVYKIYAESFRSAAHLKLIQSEAQAIVAQLFAGKT
jgi:phosphoglucomutase